MPHIAITGANSAVGTAILSEIAASSGDTRCTGVVRSERAGESLRGVHPDAEVAVIPYSDRAGLAKCFADCDAVIHLPGVLIERKGSTYQQANVETARAVIDAAATRPDCKFVLISAVGADPDAKNRYYASKGQAENILRASGLPFSVIRAPLVLGRGTEGTQAILRHLNTGSPRLLGGGRQLQQPIDARDLARGCLSATRPGIARGRTVNLVGPEALLERELVERTAALLGKTVSIGSVPIAAIRLFARIRTAVAGPGFSADAVDVICDDTKLDSEPAASALELTLTPLATTLQEMCGETR